MSGVISLLRLTVSALVTGLVIAACTPRPEPDAEPESSGGDEDAGASSGSTQESPTAEASIGEDVTLRLAITPPVPSSDTAIEFVLTLSNGSSEELVVDFPDGQRFDFEVLRADASVWRWAADMFFPQMLGRERIEAGGSMPWSVRLEEGLAAGEYTLRGTLTSNERHVLELVFTID
ncbi:MAG: BsuPI-related putative proteinase inhibitor [Gemmatimonadota bacterium]|nr:BsuPI-related putative proteinase inhibitor [Gemmatimonadota bacterium]